MFLLKHMYHNISEEKNSSIRLAGMYAAAALCAVLIAGVMFTARPAHAQVTDVGSQSAASASVTSDSFPFGYGGGPVIPPITFPPITIIIPPIIFPPFFFHLPPIVFPPLHFF
jgi:hypothetical protein